MSRKDLGAGFAPGARTGEGRRALLIDLLFRYPFPGGDGYDWIANGLAWAGEATRFSGRPPLLPLLIALLYRLGALALLPVLLLGMLGLLAGACAAVAVPEGERRGQRRLLVALLVLVPATFLRQGLEVMADVSAAALGAASLALGLRALRLGRERGWLGAGALAGLASLAQPAGLYPLAGLALAVLLRRRALLRSPWLWTGLALALLPTPAAALARFLATGSAENVAFLHRTLLGFYPEQLAYYGDALPAALGVPLALLLLLGLGACARSLARDAAPEDLAALGGGAAVALFFGVLYGFPAQRFAIYLAPLLAVAFERALEILRTWTRPAVVPAAAALALATAALPSGGEHVILVWPLPLVRADLEQGGLLVGGLAERFRQHPLRELASYLARERTSSLLSPERFADVEAVVFLYDEAASGTNFFVEALRLGNAIGRRGRALPAGLLPEGFFPRDALEAPFASEGYRLRRFAPLEGRGAPGERTRVWLVAVSEGSGLDLERWVSRRPRRPVVERLATELEAARCVDRLLPARDAPLVLLGDEVDSAVAATLFGTGTGTLLVVPPEDAGRWRARLDGLEPEAEAVCGELAATRIRWRGFPYTVARKAAAAS